MAPSRKKGARAASSAAAAQQWKVGDLVLAKMKGFPAWPAMVSEPEKWGYSSDRKKLLVYFYGTKQIAFCNYADLEAFTEEKKKSLLVKRQGKGSDFVRAVEEIIDIYERKQNSAETNSWEEGINSNTVHSEGSRSKPLNKSQEDSCHVTNQHQTEALIASAKSTDAIIPEDAPRTSVESDLHDTSLASEPSVKVSILDQLRQTPLSTTTTTRKRQRDGSQQSYVIQRAPSLRRSRSSSGSDPSKLRKPSMLENGTEQAGAELVSDTSQEDLILEKRLTVETAQTPLTCNCVPPSSANLLSNDSSEEGVASDVAATRSDAEDGSMSESSCKLEKLNKYLEKDLGLNGSITLNRKFELPIKAVIFKKKRKPNRKRVANTQDCTTLVKEVDMQAELHENLLDSPNTCKGIVENISKADGDEHLPLVKRARVRMGKPAEETQVDALARGGETLEQDTALEDSDKCLKSFSPVGTCPADRTSRDKEVSSSSPVNDYSVAAGRDPICWKANKYRLKGIALDVEAALPPSKRLHRALEAMSANAAEATNDTSRGPADMEMISVDCSDSPKIDTLHAVNENVESATSSLCIQSSDNTAFQSSMSCVTKQNLEVPVLRSSEEKRDDSTNHDLMSTVEIDCKETSVAVRESGTPFTYTVADANMHGQSLGPCSSKSVEKWMTSANTTSVLDQLTSPSGNENGNENSIPSQRCDSGGDAARENLNEESNVRKSDPSLNFKDGSDYLPSNGTGLIPPAAIFGSATSNTSGTTKSLLFDEDLHAKGLPDVAKVISRVTPKDWGTSELTPMKDLIAAAQAKRLLSRSTSFSDNAVDGKIFIDDVVSPSGISRGDSSVQGSPHNLVVYHRPATDDRSYHIQNGSRSPMVNQRDKGFNKSTATVEANITRRSFETLLCTLSRTKESIGRATRAAMDCAKCGVAGEVIEILIQHLERESSLYKKIDLFFLVDSITQYSRSQKGGYGDLYLSLVQSALPRLLSAAAPHGNAAWENRRQCLKVLRLWLERKTLAESVVRYHIRELESVNETSLTSSYSRRPPRTERALNDPIREMEGMFVDEYGSNTSFQLQNFIRPRLLEDEEGSGDDEKSFEAVTPECSAEIVDEKGTAQTPNEKHRHILEDVDGELEMEDVAPPCEVEASHVAGADSVSNPHYPLENCQLLPPAPPLPQDMPPSPPPLPASPPPIAPPCPASHTAIPQQLPGSHAFADVSDFHHHSTNNIQNHQSQQPNNFQGNLAASESVPYYNSGYGGITKQIPPPPPPPPPPVSSSGPYGSHTIIQSGNNFQTKRSPPSTNKAYHLQPPPPTVSNQFSYIQAESQQRQSWESSSYGDRFQYANDPQGGSYLADRNLRRPIQHENAERGTFSPAVNRGHALSDKARTSGSHSRYGPPSEPSGNSCNGWPVPPRIPSYSVSASRPSMENPTSRTTGGYWRPR